MNSDILGSGEVYFTWQHIERIAVAARHFSPIALDHIEAAIRAEITKAPGDAVNYQNLAILNLIRELKEIRVGKTVAATTVTRALPEKLPAAQNAEAQ
jgi:hypothetical protein